MTPHQQAFPSAQLCSWWTVATAHAHATAALEWNSGICVWGFGQAAEKVPVLKKALCQISRVMCRAPVRERPGNYLQCSSLPLGLTLGLDHETRRTANGRVFISPHTLSSHTKPLFLQESKAHLSQPSSGPQWAFQLKAVTQ